MDLQFFFFFLGLKMDLHFAFKLSLSPSPLKVFVFWKLAEKAADPSGLDPSQGSIYCVQIKQINFTLTNSLLFPFRVKKNSHYSCNLFKLCLINTVYLVIQDVLKHFLHFYQILYGRE